MTGLCAIRGLTVAYEGQALPALDAVDLTINIGERLAVIGESGSGKSTLVRSLAGLLPPHAEMSGDIRWAGGRPVPGRDIGFVFQDPGASLNPVLSIGEQVAEGARYHLGLSWKDAMAHALEMLERVRIPQARQRLKAYPHQLSGGQRQRVAIAAALSARPRILIADEVTSALDTILQAEIVALLDALVREAGMTLIFVTHDIALASGFADRLAIFRQGRLIESGPTSAVLDRPANPYTKSLLSSHLDLSSPPLIERASR